MSRFVVAGGVALVSLTLAACDPVPMTEFRNGAHVTVTLKSESAVSVLGELKAAPRIAVGRRVRTLSVPDALTIATAQCDYLYAIPKAGLVKTLGAVNHVEIAPDLALHLRAPASEQTPGWPVSPTSKTCR